MEPTNQRSRRRHGRGLRSPVTGPLIPPLGSRREIFAFEIDSTVEHLRGLWPELEKVKFEIHEGSDEAIHEDHIDRWVIDHTESRITFFRLPITRFDRMAAREGNSALIEPAQAHVYHAVASYLGKEPWELEPNHDHHG